MCVEGQSDQINKLMHFVTANLISSESEKMGAFYWFNLHNANTEMGRIRKIWQNATMRLCLESALHWCFCPKQYVTRFFLWVVRLPFLLISFRNTSVLINAEVFLSTELIYECFAKLEWLYSSLGEGGWAGIFRCVYQKPLDGEFQIQSWPMSSLNQSWCPCL